MASKASKKEKRDEAHATAVASMPSLVKLLEEHRDALSKEFKSAITSLEAKLDFVQETVTDHGSRLTSLEANAYQLSDKMEELEAKCAAMEGSYNKLKAKAIDLESRSRRNNIRIAGLPESIEGARPTDLFLRLLVELLGPHYSSGAGPSTQSPDCQAKSRVKTKSGNSPHSSFQTKELIVQEARKQRGKLFFQGKPVAIFEDYCPEIVEQRAAYREALDRSSTKPGVPMPTRHWRFNSSLLSDDEFVKYLKDHITFFLEMNTTSDTSALMVWDALKAYLRGQIISFTAHKRRKAQRERSDLLSNISGTDAQYALTPTPELYNTKLELKTKFDLLTTYQTQNILLKNKSTFYEHGEKAGKLLANQLKGRRSKQLITSINTQSGNVTQDPTEINTAFKDFYSKLFDGDDPRIKTNPVVRHTLKVWVQFRRSFGHKDFSLLSPVASNHFRSSRHDSTFQGWHGKGISQFKDMFTNGNFMSFDQLSEKYNLPKTHFFRYLQARHYVRSVLPCFPKEPDSNPVDMFLSFNPMSPKAMSTLYRNISTLIQAPLVSIKLAWEHDLGQSLEDDLWDKSSHQSINLHSVQDTALYNVNPTCDKCKINVATLFHMYWLCPRLQEFWETFSLSNILNQKLDPDP
ncbi:hypothetical protein F7725_020451, partial [Dissostichus mawsoni]